VNRNDLLFADYGVNELNVQRDHGHLVVNVGLDGSLKGTELDENIQPIWDVEKTTYGAIIFGRKNIVSRSWV
jgi:hypothetical protein